MSTGFKPLGNDQVGASLFEPACFRDARRIADHGRAGRFDAIEKNRIGKAEVETDDLRAEILDHRAHPGVEWQAQWTAVAGRDAELAVIRIEQLASGAVVRFGHLVAEEIEVKRA